MCVVCVSVSFFFCLRVSTGVPAGPLKRDAGNVLLCSLASGVCFPWRHPRLAPHTDSAPMVVGSVVQRQQQEGFLSDLSHHWSFLPDDGKFHHLNQPLSFFFYTYVWGRTFAQEHHFLPLVSQVQIYWSNIRMSTVKHSDLWCHYTFFDNSAPPGCKLCVSLH